MELDCLDKGVEDELADGEEEEVSSGDASMRRGLVDEGISDSDAKLREFVPPSRFTCSSSSSSSSSPFSSIPRTDPVPRHMHIHTKNHANYFASSQKKQ